MPELPEVETIRRGLEKRLVGSRITGVELRYAGSWGEGSPQNVIGAKIDGMERQGKLLLFRLDNGRYLTVHLKMTGQLIWQSADDAEAVAGGHPEASYLEPLPHKHTHVIFSFDDGSHLYFNDLRKFGRINVLTGEQVQKLGFIQTLGPDPFSKDYTLEYLRSQLHKRPRQPIKLFLLDQANVAGLGNIYADETLFAAKIHPLRPAGSLSGPETESLYAAIPEVLGLALAHGGSSKRDYVNAVGEKGTYLRVAKVYHRTGLPCLGCTGTVERIKLGGRSTHFCPSCQQ